MSKTNGVGASEWTPFKLEVFNKIIRMHISITKNTINKHKEWCNQTYYYYDANAGPGIYEAAGQMVRGSPLQFLDAAESHRLNYEANFIEIRSDNLSHLENCIPSLCYGYFRSFCGNHTNVIPDLIKKISKKKYGLLFIDMSGDRPNFDMIRYFRELRPRCEILIHLSATNLKREYHLTENLLSDYIADMDKKYWLVRKPASYKSFQFTFLLGSSSKLFDKDYKSIGLYRLNSKEAKEFFPILNLSDKQRNGQLSFDLRY